ncbi:MAG TPA: hypothetical protein VKA68_11850 [bacterium]|nr:hypothetical protein [bacterium]
MIQLPSDFRKFLQLLNEHEVRYLVVGGYAVGFHGYPRATGDLDIWIAVEPRSAQKLVMVLKEFGFDVPDLTPEVFQQPEKIIRLGNPPLRIEIHTALSGIQFEECYPLRVEEEIEGIHVTYIDLHSLRKNKQASGRYRDLDDLEHLPE